MNRNQNGPKFVQLTHLEGSDDDPKLVSFVKSTANLSRGLEHVILNASEKPFPL